MSPTKTFGQWGERPVEGTLPASMLARIRGVFPGVATLADIARLKDYELLRVPALGRGKLKWLRQVIAAERDRSQPAVPADIIASAQLVWAEWFDDSPAHDTGIISYIARAVLAERERCAQIADAQFQNRHNDAGRHLAGRIAAAIRAGGQ